MSKNLLGQVLHELRFMFGPVAPVMLLCHLDTNGKAKSFVGVDGKWIKEWCELRKII